MHPTLRLVLAGAATAAVLGGCGGAAPDSQGQVRLVNATREFATMDLYSSSSLLSRGVASYGTGSYIDLDPGSYTFNLTEGGSPAVSATLTGSVAVTKHQTILAYTSGGTLTGVYLSDDEGAPDSGTAKLRVFNTASTDAGSVDVYLVTTECATLPSSLAAPTASGVTGLQSGYTQVSATGSGTAYHVCVTGNGDKTDLRLDIPSTTLKDQQIVTLVLVRSTGGVLLNGLLLQQQGAVTAAPNSSARIRLAVGAAGSAAVSASVNGTPLGSGLTAPAVGAYRLIAAGPLTTAVTVGATTAPALASTADPGADYTLLVTGDGGTEPVLIVDDNTVSTSTSKPVKMRLVNGMGGLAGNAFLTIDSNDIGGGAAFGTASTYGQLASSAALAQVQVTSGNATLCKSSNVTLNSGAVYSVFVLGDPPSGIPPGCTLRTDR